MENEKKMDKILLQKRTMGGRFETRQAHLETETETFRYIQYTYIY